MKKKKMLMGLERICQEEWDKLPKSSCAKLVETYPRRLGAVTAAKGLHIVINRTSQFVNEASQFLILICFQNVHFVIIRYYILQHNTARRGPLSLIITSVHPQ